MVPAALVRSLDAGSIDRALFPELRHVIHKDSKVKGIVGKALTYAQSMMVYFQRLKDDLESCCHQEGLVHLITGLADALNDEYPGNFDQIAVYGNPRGCTRDNLWEMYTVRNKPNRLFGPQCFSCSRFPGVCAPRACQHC